METIAELRLIRGFTDEVLLKLGARRVGGIIDPSHEPVSHRGADATGG